MPSYFKAKDWYELPGYYDLVFQEGTELEADFLEAALATHGRSKGRRILEPACGSGRLIAEFARRGYRTTGFDASRAMLDYAGTRLAGRKLQARLVQGRLEDFGFRTWFDLAFCLISTFRYLTSEAKAQSHLECVARVLVEGGLYVLGLHLSDYGCKSKSRERHVASRDNLRLVCNIQSWPPDRKRRRERYRSRLTATKKRVVERYETEWDFRTYDARQLTALLRKVRRLEHVATYDFDYDIDRPSQLESDRLDRVLILRKTGARRTG